MLRATVVCEQNLITSETGDGNIRSEDKWGRYRLCKARCEDKKGAMEEVVLT